MSLACLVKVSPLSIVTGARIDVYAASRDDSSILGLNGIMWEPALVTAPTLTMTLWDGDFTSPVQPGGATIPLQMNVLKHTYAADGCLWTGAPVEIYAEEPGTAWPWTLRFKGKVSGFNRKDQEQTLTASVDTEPFQANVLTATYAGTGGAEGSTSLKDRVKPLVIGRASNVEPVLIDEINSVYQFSGYGAIESVTALYERGASFGSKTADYATYADLVAATIPAGRWATSLATGMVRLGAPAAGVITGDVRGHKVTTVTARLTGAVITALAGIAGISSSLLDSASLTALDTALPYPINLVLTEQTTFFDIANTLARCCNCQSGVDLLGLFFVSQVGFSGSDALTLDTSGTQYPEVLRSDELDTSVPYYRTAFGAQRSWRVHTADEIAWYANLLPMGTYSSTATYREGNWVTLADGSAWLYINATASSGHAPPTWPTTSNAYWDNLNGPMTASSVKYADGTTIETLKPAEGGATNGAPTGSPVGDIDAGDVSSTINLGGGVADNQVGTGAIIANAVSADSLVITNAAVNLLPAGTMVDLQTLSFTCKGGDVLLWGRFDTQWTITSGQNTYYVTYQLLRNGTPIAVFGPGCAGWIVPGTIGSTGNGAPFAFSWIDYPGAGAVTYKLQAMVTTVGTGTFSSIVANRRQLMLIEVKK